MSRHSKITKAAKRAKRGNRNGRGLSGKDRAAGEREDEFHEGEVETVESPPVDRMANWAEGETRVVDASDRAILRYGAVLVKNACKNAHRLNASLGIAKEETQTRLNQAEALIALVDNADSRKDVTVPPHLLRCAQIGVSMEYSNVAKGKEHQEKKLKVDDTKPLDKRLLELDRLATELGVQGSLALVHEDEEEEEGDQVEADLEPAGAAAE